MEVSRAVSAASSKERLGPPPGDDETTTMAMIRIEQLHGDEERNSYKVQQSI